MSVLCKGIGSQDEEAEVCCKEGHKCKEEEWFDQEVCFGQEEYLLEAEQVDEEMRCCWDIIVDERVG